MALYAFDGTWNSRKDTGQYGRNTNVVRFVDAYAQHRDRHFYTKGVGTKHGRIGRLLGGAFGVGGHGRIRDAQRNLFDNYAGGDRAIDVVGYSRGAALALDFVNAVASKGIRHPDTGEVLERHPEIRFLGVWDVVASFGIPINLGIPFTRLRIPFNRINLGYRLSPPENVTNICHALALDERRASFRPTRVESAREVWFRGTHGDVGGGNGNLAHNAISLRWMLSKAAAAGLPISPSAITVLAEIIDPDARISTSRDPVKQRWRSVGTRDRLHYTVSARVGPQYAGLPRSSELETVDDERLIAQP